VYVVQACEKGGIIIAKLHDLKDDGHLQITEGTLRVSKSGDSSLPKFGNKISYFQMAQGSKTEFDCFAYSLVCNTLTTRIFRSPVYPNKLLWKDPYVRRRTDEDLERWQTMVDTCRKYGMAFLYEHPAEYIADFTILYPKLIAETYDRSAGTFQPACERWEGTGRDTPRIDVSNVEARKLMEEYWVQYFRYFKRLPYVEVTEREAKGTQKDTIKIEDDLYYYGGWFYSRGSLESYRQFVRDPEARFPVAPGDRGTERTRCTSDKKDWAKYKKWIIDAWTEGTVLVMARAGKKAFEGNPAYVGLSYMDGGFVSPYHQRYLLDMKKIIADPGVALFVNEHGWLSKRGQQNTEAYRSLVKEHGKKQIMLVTLQKHYLGFGPGDIPAIWSGGLPLYSYWESGQALWKIRRIFTLFPDLHGMAWHSSWNEDLLRFWMAYQTVEWGRGVMPLRRARAIMDSTVIVLDQYRDDFDYDEKHVFRKVKVLKASSDFDIFDQEPKAVADAYEHKITAPAQVHRDGPGGNRTCEASFRVVAAGEDRLCVLVTVTDEIYAAAPDEYRFPVGKGWAWKDKVDIYLGFASTIGVYQGVGADIRGRGVLGRRSPPGEKRYTHVVCTSRAGRGNTVWLEARCGETRVPCYYLNEKTGKTVTFAAAAWQYSQEGNEWTGRIDIDLKAIDERLDVSKLTGFNLGIQDVDRPCGRQGHTYWIREPDKDPFYLLYEAYPHGVHDTARYADVDIGE